MSTFDEVDAVARYQALVKVELKNRLKADDQRVARALIVADAKRNLDADAYKAFLTKIECADSTSRELLKIAKAGSADDVRRANALRVAQHRERQAERQAAVTVTAPVAPLSVFFTFKGNQNGRNHKKVIELCRSSGGHITALDFKGPRDRNPNSGFADVPPDAVEAFINDMKAAGFRADPPVAKSVENTPPLTPAEGVRLAASQGVTMTEPEAAECIRLAKMPEAEFEAHVAAECKHGVEPIPAADAELAAFEFGYSSNEHYNEVRERAAKIGITLPPPQAGRGNRMIRVYVPITKAIEENLHCLSRVPLWAARARDARDWHDDRGHVLSFMHEAVSALENAEGWRENLSNPDYDDDSRLAIDDNVLAGAKAAADAWAKLYETMLRRARETKS